MQSIYLDNAATSFPKPAGVSDSMKQYLDCVGATINRSVYRPRAGGRAGNAGSARGARAAVPVPGACDHVVLTPGATFGLNLVIKGLAAAGDHLHRQRDGAQHAVMRPLQQHRGRGISTASPATARAFCSMARSRACSGPTRALLCWHMRPTSAACVQDAAAVGGSPVRGNRIAFSCWTARKTAGHYHHLTLRRSALSALAVPGHKGLLGPERHRRAAADGRACRHLTPLGDGAGTGSCLGQVRLLPPYLPGRAGNPARRNLPGIYGLRAALVLCGAAGVEPPAPA